MAEKKVGDILDGLGVVVDMDDGDLVASAVVLLKVVTADGGVTLAIASDEGCSWLEQLGIVAAAGSIVNKPDDFTQREVD